MTRLQYSSGMRNDLYLRVVLTVIAGALVYLCVVLTPMPSVSAQTGRIVGGKTPGEYTGPAEVTIVDWRLPAGASLPVTVTRGDVRITNEVSVSGSVEVTQTPNNPLRSVVVGYEDGATSNRAGQFQGLLQATGRGVPVNVSNPGK
jgi:hypothetical protein